MVHTECTFYKAPGNYVDPKTDQDFEGSAWCEMDDCACYVEYGGRCGILEGESTVNGFISLEEGK